MRIIELPPDLHVFSHLHEGLEACETVRPVIDFARLPEVRWTGYIMRTTCGEALIRWNWPAVVGPHGR